MAIAHAHDEFDHDDENQARMSSTDQPGAPDDQSATVTEMHRLDKKITKEKASRKVGHSELKVQIRSLEATTAAGFTEVHAKMDAGFTEVHAKMDAGFTELRGQVAEKMADLTRTMVLAHVAIAIVMLAGVAGIMATIVNLALS